LIKKYCEYIFVNNVKVANTKAYSNSSGSNVYHAGTYNICFQMLGHERRQCIQVRLASTVSDGMCKVKVECEMHLLIQIVFEHVLVRGYFNSICIFSSVGITTVPVVKTAGSNITGVS
jgi:hypothetical protein